MRIIWWMASQYQGYHKNYADLNEQLLAKIELNVLRTSINLKNVLNLSLSSISSIGFKHKLIHFTLKH